MALKIEPIGTPRKISSDHSIPEAAASLEQLKLTDNEMYSARFALAGTETQKITGHIRIAATLPFADGPLSSKEVELNVKAVKDLSADERGQLETHRTLAEAQTAFAAEKFADAEKLAREVIKKNRIRLRRILSSRAAFRNRTCSAKPTTNLALHSTFAVRLRAWSMSRHTRSFSRDSESPLSLVLNRSHRRLRKD